MVVPRAQHDAIVEQVAAGLRSVAYGDPADQANYMGPLISERQRDKVDGLVQRAVAAGATLVTGGEKVDPGYFYTPTLLDGVSSDAAILDTEIFGPVAPVVRFTNEADAVRWANASEFGLVTYVYTQDLRRGLRVSEALEAGMIGLNRGLVSDPAAPFGGVKQSGLGREGAHEGLLEYTETKYIATDW
jgi:succinate-semialdehyde dehydrogenase/glutarate-semialdehyde dehydrogenase